jgi:hypothetical protein
VLTPFYRRAEFQGVPGRAVQPTRVPDHFQIHGEPGLRRNLILSHFKYTFPEYVGILRGTYVALDNGHALIDEDGELITINHSKDDITASKDINEHFITPAIQRQILGLNGRRNDLPLVQKAALLSHPYAQNFYHFCLDTVTKTRFLDEFDVDTVVIPSVCLAKTFQRDLLARTQAPRSVLPLNQPIRIKDPVLAHGYTSPAALFWLRQKTRFAQTPGTRRIYIHRTNLSRSTAGDCIVQTAAFGAFLEEFGFDTVDFGSGDLTMHQQIAMLDGAGLILGAHGASMTNIAFINPPATIIELFGRRVFGGFMDIAANLDLRYHGIICEDFDGDGNMIPDCAELRALISSLI